MAISSVMNASSVSSISPRYPIASLPQLERLSAHSSPLTVNSGSTVTLHNHSSGASMAPTLGYLSTPYPQPPPPAANSYAYNTLTKESKGKNYKSLNPGVCPRAYMRFQAVPINVYNPKLLCVASCNHEAPCQREFLVRSCSDIVLLVSSHVH